MIYTTLSFLLTLIGIYIAIGLMFAFAFVFVGIGKVDDGAKDISIGVRLLLIPGSIAFWPTLFKKWRQTW